MIAVNPEILKWARETAGLDLDEAARKLGFRDSKRSSASEKLTWLEHGEKDPTRAQLYKMADVYHQPAVIFYLPVPPRKSNYGQDFRTLPEGGFARKDQAHLNLLMRDVKASQHLMRDLLEEDNAEPHTFVGSVTMSAGVDAVARDITNILEFDLHTFRDKGKIRKAFAYLRQKIESKGIFVLLLSDLGSHHTSIPVEVFRGFVYADDIAPYIVINRRDAVSAWSFTALHELAHLWLGNSSISSEPGENDAATERFCNQVAGEILFSAAERAKLKLNLESGFERVVEQISELADERNISQELVAYSLLLERRISPQLWQRLKQRRAQDRQQLQRQERESRKGNSGGPSFYAVRKHQLGEALVALTRYYMSTGDLTVSKAGAVLGVAPRNVYPLLRPELTQRLP